MIHNEGRRKWHRPPWGNLRPEIKIRIKIKIKIKIKTTSPKAGGVPPVPPAPPVCHCMNNRTARGPVACLTDATFPKILKRVRHLPEQQGYCRPARAFLRSLSVLPFVPWVTQLMSREAIFRSSVSYFLGPIGSYLDDPTVTEIMVNRFDEVYIERQGRLERTDASFPSEDVLLSAVRNVAQWVGREIDHKNPILDARLPDGSRVHAIVPPGARRGTCLTIRKFHQGGLTLDQLIRYGSLSVAAREFLELAVVLHKNIIISGGTGTGKTSLLGAVSRAIPTGERVVVIEDTSEIKLEQDHCIYLEVQRGNERGEGALSIRDLFVSSLRMRPDRIIVGEVRGGEALDMVQSMLSGHSGSLSTVHANSARDAVTRLETLSLMSDVKLPVYVARAQVASAIHLIVQVARFVEDGSRKVTRITEVHGLGDDQQYELLDLFECHLAGKDDQGRLIAQLQPTGQLPSFAAEPYEQGLDDRIRHSAPLWRRP